MLSAGPTLADRLKQARTARQIGQAELAKLIGISQPSYSALERGTSKSTSKIASIAKLLNVNAFWLETGEGASGLEPGTAEAGMPVRRVAEPGGAYGPPDERKLVEMYRRLPPRKKRAILDLLTGEVPEADN